jgi:hypothetical protein
VFGCAETVRDLAQKRALFERMTASYFPERSAGRDYYPARAGDLRAVELLAVRIEEQSAKTRTGGPRGAHDAEEDAGMVTGFVVELPGIDS